MEALVAIEKLERYLIEKENLTNYEMRTNVFFFSLDKDPFTEDERSDAQEEQKRRAEEMREVW